MPGTSPFEGKLVRLINQFLQEAELPGLSYRLKQSHFYTQFVDVLVDSANPIYYLAIECKSMGPTSDKIYFSSHFSVDKKGEHQVTRISDFLNKTQRFGILAIEKRHGRGKGSNEVVFLPWHQVERWYESGVKSIDPAALSEKYPRLVKSRDIGSFDYILQALRQF